MDRRTASSSAIRNPRRDACLSRHQSPLQTLLDYVEGGETLDEFLDDFPTVTREAAVRALEHAKTLLVTELG